MAAIPSFPTSTSKSSVTHLLSDAESSLIRRVALVSHDYNLCDSRGFYDYTEHFADINRLCDDQNCDTILYALYTWDRNSPTTRDPSSCFAGLNHVRRIIVEVGQPKKGSFDHVEVLQKGERRPLIAQQRFAKSGDSKFRKAAFIEELDERKLGDALLVLCGETNIGSTERGSTKFNDPYDFLGQLKTMGIRLILNPIHDYMTRYEMRRKRRRYSQRGITVISVWNQGKAREAELPWTVFRDGEELTDELRELPKAFAGRPDIRIGIVEVERVANR